MAYKAVKLMESREHISGSIVHAIQSNGVRFAEIIRFVILKVDIASCICGKSATIFDSVASFQDTPALSGIHWCKVRIVSSSELNISSFK